MKKVYVMSEGESSQHEAKLMGERDALWARWELAEPFDKTQADRYADAAIEIAQQLIGVRDARATMTSIDIPDGCQLAVVNMNDVPHHNYLDEGGYIEIKEWDYRRVVQVVEVK